MLQNHSKNSLPNIFSLITLLIDHLYKNLYDTFLTEWSKMPKDYCSKGTGDGDPFAGLYLHAGR